jgi:hypothetical protein
LTLPDRAPEIAKELGSFIMDFSDVDELVTILLSDLLEGPSDHLGTGFSDILQPLPLTVRINLLKDTYEHLFGLEQLKKYSETFKEFDQIIRQRNRMAHDWWGDPYGLADNPEDDWLMLIKSASDRKSSQQDVSPSNLRALRQATANIEESLRKFGASFNIAENMP